MASNSSPAFEDETFTLDEALLSRRRAASARRLHGVQIPAVRGAGFAILCLIAVMRDWQADPQFPRPELLLLVGINLAFAALAGLFQRMVVHRPAATRLSLVLFHLDVLVWLINLHHLEPGNLFFAFFLLVRVVDQIGFGFQRALYFSHVITLAYLAYALGIVHLQPAQAYGGDRIGIAVTMYLLGLYFAVIGLVTGRLRQRSQDAMRAARALVESLRQKADALQAQTVALEQARLQAEAASLAKSQFLAVISHEIRTPMNGILGSSELLMNSPLTQRQAHLVRTAHRSGTALLGLIDDLLNLSSIEAGKLALHPSNMDLRQVATEAIELMAIAARDKPVALSCQFDPQLPARVIADPKRLRQLVVNLLHNAVKFTDRGSVELRVQVLDSTDIAADADQSLRVQLTVRDTGIGIAPQHIDAIFDAFTQVDSSTTRRHGGSGLGLAIVRQLAALMRGELSVQSQLGVGSEFRVVLPLRRAAGSPTVDQELPDLQTSEAGSPTAVAVRTLLVEDDPVNRIVVTEMLKMLGCTVDVAEDGAAGWRAAVAGHYDIVFMDCHMPVLDGYEASRRIRADEAEGFNVANGPGARRAVIVALTADALARDHQRCIDAGMDAVLTKPVSSRQLSETIERWTGRRTFPSTQW